MKRVVVTGGNGVTPIGEDWISVRQQLVDQKNGIAYLPEWDEFKDLHTRLGGPVADFALPESYPRKKTRSMGRVAQLGTRSAELALIDAGLIGHEVLTDGRTGVAYGSSSGSIKPLQEFYSMLMSKEMDGVNATTYLRMMGHTAAVNIGIFFGLTGRLIPTGTACTSGSMAIGYAYEAIKYGHQSVMVAGGAEELSPTQAAVFDTLYATSIKNDTPELTPRPFDKDRDGLVIGEGAGTLVLEEYEFAKARGATILAELVGFGTNTDGAHLTQPNSKTMQVAIRKALDEAGISASDIGYISAHATATTYGDVAESKATYDVFGSTVPISGQKGWMGHTLGACGSIEAWMAIQMMQEGWFAPNLNLKTKDENCADLDYIMGDGREMSVEYVMSNNFAFGGINTSLVFKRV